MISKSDMNLKIYSSQGLEWRDLPFRLKKKYLKCLLMPENYIGNLVIF